MFGIRDEAIEEYPLPGVTRRILTYNKYLMVMEGHLAKGTVVDHAHPHTQITYVVSGEMEVTAEGEKRHLKAGDCVVAEPNVHHLVVALTDVVLIDTFNPCREDYIPERDKK
ncbi:MAG: cupin domain-containing protein [Phascolarctobacterium sp.]|nr:cupin domain-containing protein [Phascolarctobacterium sp.]